MKNRKFLYTLLVLVLVLAIGIGYAAVTKELVVGGGVTTDAVYNGSDNEGIQQNFKVHFDTTKTVDDEDVKVTYADDLVANVVVTNMGTLGDKQTIQLTIVNESEDLKAAITPPAALNCNTDYFRIEIIDWPTEDVTLDEVDVTPDGEGGNLVVVDSVTFTIEIELIKSPTSNQEAEINFVFNAEAIEA